MTHLHCSSGTYIHLCNFHITLDRITIWLFEAFRFNSILYTTTIEKNSYISFKMFAALAKSPAIFHWIINGGKTHASHFSDLEYCTWVSTFKHCAVGVRKKSLFCSQFSFHLFWIYFHQNNFIIHRIKSLKNILQVTFLSTGLLSLQKGSIWKEMSFFVYYFIRQFRKIETKLSSFKRGRCAREHYCLDDKPFSIRQGDA